MYRISPLLLLGSVLALDELAHLVLIVLQSILTCYRWVIHIVNYYLFCGCIGIALSRSECILGQLKCEISNMIASIALMIDFSCPHPWIKQWCNGCISLIVVSLLRELIPLNDLVVWLIIAHILIASF